MTKMKIGIIGCGNISPAYLNYLDNSDVVEVYALADLLPEKAHKRAKEYGIANVCTVEEMLEHKEIGLILNLTIPSSHAAVNYAVLDHGLIGKPVAATAFMMGAGPEGWHPNPEFFYTAGGGPMFDMGPYYLTTLVQLVGPIRRISGSAGSNVPERIVQSGLRAGTVIPVSTPTHYSGTLDFVSGVIGTLVTSFDIPGGSTLPWIEIYGTAGTLLVPDPNTFDGDVKIRRYDSEEWEIVPPVFNGGPNDRGRGIEDMVRAISEERDHRASGLVAYHVLEAMHAFETSSREGRHVELTSAEMLVKKSQNLVLTTN
ncbi:Predicted dehydrogenase [Fontibacillus panacisegetis]|uniref:Predicted dehydrogenase n=1 Tax=Fontibacillus panacisegetis TaxID=670482 RepID=A0A1G7I971_9BACL|nr:Gfo/Idh/MocA family oxidoreductase [Fontibacillus panacisegetis]SDF09245.1 Predicted dehydrogenase [Fontibacillus panacisegetis]